MIEMKAMKRKGLRFVLGATVATLVVGVAVPANATVPDVTPPAVELMDHTLVGSGSDTTYDMMKTLDRVYAGANGCATIWAVSGNQPKNGACDPTGSAAGNNVALFPWVNDTHDVVSERYPVGSGNGIKELCNQGLPNVREVDFARSSSGKASTGAGASCKDLMYVAYAKDAVSWWHETNGTSSAIASISTAVLKAIYTGVAQTLPCDAAKASTTWDATVTCTAGNVTTVVDQWSDLEGLTGVKDSSGNNFNATDNTLSTNSIYVYYAQPGSGTVDYWAKQLGGGSVAITFATANPRFIDTVQENNPGAVQADAHHADGIYFMSYGRFRQTAGTTAVYDNTSAEYTDATHNSALGQINDIAPTHGLILAGTGTFPNARNVYNVLRYPTEKVLRYLGPEGLLCSTTIGGYTDRVTGKTYRTLVEDSIKGEGFVPLASGSTGGASFDGKYGLSGTMDTTASYCRVTDYSADLSYTDTVAPTVGLDVAPTQSAVNANAATFVFNEPVTSIDPTKIGIRSKDAVLGTWNTTYLDDTAVSYYCFNQKQELTYCDGTDPANPNRYGQELIAKVVVLSNSTLNGTTVTFSADAGAGSDRAGNPSAAFNVDNAALNVNYVFNAQSVAVPSKVAPAKSKTFSRTTTVGGAAISVTNLTKKFCTVRVSGGSYKVLGLRKGTCRLSLSAAGTTNATTGDIYSPFAKVVSIAIKK